MLCFKGEGGREKRMRRQKSCFQVFFFFAPAITNHLFSFWIFTNTWSGIDLLLMLVRTKIIVENEKVLDKVFLQNTRSVSVYYYINFLYNFKVLIVLMSTKRLNFFKIN